MWTYSLAQERLFRELTVPCRLYEAKWLRKRLCWVAKTSRNRGAFERMDFRHWYWQSLECEHIGKKSYWTVEARSFRENYIDNCSFNTSRRPTRRSTFYVEGTSTQMLSTYHKTCTSLCVQMDNKHKCTHLPFIHPHGKSPLACSETHQLCWYLNHFHHTITFFSSRICIKRAS